MNGRLRLFVAGTSTPKVAYSDTAGTSYGSTIALDSSGLPEDGPIYWDNDTLYDVAVDYLNSDGVTYTQDYLVPNFGNTFSAVGTDLNQNLISNWSFEVAGSGAEPFENWTATDSGSVITRDTVNSIHGTASALFTNTENSEDYVESIVFEVSPLKDVALDFFLETSATTASPAVAVYWLDGAQAAISNEFIYEGDQGTSPTTWAHIEGLVVTPPSNARYGQLRVIGNTSPALRTSSFDGIHIRQISKRVGATATAIPNGMNISISLGDTDHDVSVSEGGTLDSNFSEEIVLVEALTKQLDSTWAAGDDAGGLFSGSSIPVSGRLGVYVIKNTSSGAVDIGFDDDAALSPSLPTGFDKYRYLGTILTDENQNLVSCRWYGDRMVRLDALVADINDTNLFDNVPKTATINAPPTAEINYQARIEILSGNATEIIGWVRPANANWTLGKFGSGMETSDDTNGEFWWENKISLDDDSQIDYGLDFQGHPDDGTGVQYVFYVAGWTDYKRNNPSV